MILRDQHLEEFKQNLLPCGNCEYADVCKYADNSAIRPFKLPDNFEVTITCKEQYKWRNKDELKEH